MKPNRGIAVDAWCKNGSGGGQGGYRGIDLESKKILFEVKLTRTTNNLAEYLAISSAIKWIEIKGIKNMTIWSDSLTAIAWNRNGKYKTTMDLSKHPELKLRLDICTTYKYQNIKKWETKKWGEIPADFGRKAQKKVVATNNYNPILYLKQN